MKGRALILAVGLVAGPVAVAADYYAGLEAYEQGDYETAVREWKPLAAEGHVEAQYRLGRLYFRGEGVRDDGEAARWYREAAEQGHAESQNNLALMYEAGRGVPQDDAEAARWYREAADHGLAAARSNLARLYLEGKGVPQDEARAAIWYRGAAEQGHAQAQYSLCVLYEQGRGVPQDTEKAIKWCRKAAKKGHGPARVSLVSMYEGKDEKKAAKWRRETFTESALGIPAGEGATAAQEEVAADDSKPADEDVLSPDAQYTAELLELYERAGEGDADAQYRLGRVHNTGVGAKASFTEAGRWFLQAAEQGHEMAGYTLAFMYFRGRGLERDFLRAYAWFSLSATRGLGDAGEWRDRAAAKMSEAEIAEAESLVQELLSNEDGPSF